jgi:hypothetical protein
MKRLLRSVSSSGANPGLLRWQEAPADGEQRAIALVLNIGTYSVNGAFPHVAAKAYRRRAPDRICWPPNHRNVARQQFEQLWHRPAEVSASTTNSTKSTSATAPITVLLRQVHKRCRAGSEKAWRVDKHKLAHPAR